MTIRLLGRVSSINVRKVLWTLHELALPFETEPWGTDALPTSAPAFLALNPNGLVPVLVDHDLVLRESNTICRYLAARQQRDDLLPRAPQGRALVELWMDWQATELNTAWRVAFMALMRGNPQGHPPDAVDRSVQAWNRHMRILDGQLQRTGAFVAGDGFTLADVVIGLSVHRWRATPIDRPALPAVDAYVQRLRQRPGFVAHAQDHLP